jgi:hypothetical protein
MLIMEFTDRGGKTWQVKPRRPERVSYKLPDVCILPPKECLVLEIDYANPKVWENFPKSSQGNGPVRMRVVFEIYRDPGTELNKIWTGKVVSEPINITIHPWVPR